MFRNAKAFNGTIGTWTNALNATGMAEMFAGASSFNQSLALLGTTNVTTMAGMFSGATSFNQPLTPNSHYWNVAKVTNMAGMFRNAKAFNQPLATWDTRNVVQMEEMFRGAESFNHPLMTNGNAWNVGKVTNMARMFEGAKSFDQSLMTWKVEKVTEMTEILTDTHLSNVYYNELLSGWAALDVQTGMVFSASPAQYGGCASVNAQKGRAGRNSLQVDKGWTITDGGEFPCTNQRPMIMTWDAPSGTTITLPTVGGGYDFEVNWNYEDDPTNFT
jgi:hypothetical protein